MERMKRTGRAVQLWPPGGWRTQFPSPGGQTCGSAALSTMPNPTQVTSPVAWRVTEFNIRTRNRSGRLRTGAGQELVERSLAVAVQIQRHEFIAELPENRAQLSRHFHVQRQRHLLSGDLDPHQLAMKASSKLAKSE